MCRSQLKKKKTKKNIFLSFLGLSVLYIYFIYIHGIDIKAQRRLSCHVVRFSFFFYIYSNSRHFFDCLFFCSVSSFLLGPLYFLLLVMSNILIFYLLLLPLYVIYSTYIIWVFFGFSLLLLYMLAALYFYLFILFFFFWHWTPSRPCADMFNVDCSLLPFIVYVHGSLRRLLKTASFGVIQWERI